ncbi:phosphatase PAP2 family protein [Nostocoides veronense]|uniref:Phosphatidic acid phosphatase type 2/haloperoxidase domain-containing protein n=1 Tax=Nostocoides veronense TaxID=330836 RepID=A0ABP4Y7G3_9MICO
MVAEPSYTYARPRVARSGAKSALRGEIPAVCRPRPPRRSAPWAGLTLLVCRPPRSRVRPRASLISWATTPRVKEAIGRERPAYDNPVWSTDGLSFPSGHASNAACAAVLAAGILIPLITTHHQRAATVLAAPFALLTGLDRILLGVHYPSDVLAGWCLGAGIALLGVAGARLHPVTNRRADGPAVRGAA